MKMFWDENKYWTKVFQIRCELLLLWSITTFLHMVNLFYLKLENCFCKYNWIFVRCRLPKNLKWIWFYVSNNYDLFNLSCWVVGLSVC